MRSGETPVPIPNTMVKTWAADGTMLETAWESRWVPDFYGGVAQLGEHLPCKQGVKSSNLSISICWSDQREEAYAEISEETEAYQTYLENRILNKNELYILNQNIKTSEAIQEIVWKNKLVNAKAFMKT